ncbi:hypothetical protein GCM10007161_17290 [Ignatzschineria indica]|nr:hypothetical protein GCM10007161_17290 [Ignatzschineria indica]
MILISLPIAHFNQRVKASKSSKVGEKIGIGSKGEEDFYSAQFLKDRACRDLLS